MNSTSKKQKYPDEQHGKDRISNLPSCLLSKILSLLPTKDAVATTVLSTSWKDQWKLITRLSFDDFSLRNRPENALKSLRSQFKNFLYRVLVLGKFSHLTAFHLVCCQSYDPLFINATIASVLGCNVRELVLCVPLKNPSNALPSSLFTSTTLVRLHLSKKILLNVPSRVLLPCIRIVLLSDVRFLDDDAITRFLGGCPVLETLRVRRCLGKDVKVMKISSLSLKSLHMEWLRIDEDCSSPLPARPTFRVVLDTPLLSHILIKDCVAESYVMENRRPLQHLSTAGVHIYGPIARNMKSRLLHLNDIHRAAISDLLTGVSRAEEMSICCQDMNKCWLPRLETLRKLVISDWESLTLEVMVKFLQRTPKLESFVAVLRQDGDETGGESALRMIPDCLSSSLKIVSISKFAETSKNVEIVKYFLKNARVMERLIVAPRGDCDIGMEFLEDLPRPSSNVCQIEIPAKSALRD